MIEELVPVIKIVGLSAAGKSTLVRGLRSAGYDARNITQEHSNLPDLWNQFDVPAALICLEVDWPAQQARRSEIGWSEATRAIESERLAHARDHADLIVDTSLLTPANVLAIVSAWLEHRGFGRANESLEPAQQASVPHPASSRGRRRFSKGKTSQP